MRLGQKDILVNCIGLNREEKAEEVTEQQFDYVCDVNLKSGSSRPSRLRATCTHWGSRLLARLPRCD